jgi:hypothetical protein
VQVLKDKRKEPIYTSWKIDNTTSSQFSNISFSGFWNIWWAPFWTEIQVYTESFAAWKKIDDKKYKPKGMMKTLMRWTKFATPRDIYNLLNYRIKPSILTQLWMNSINQMIIEYIKEWFLVAYISPSWNELLITHNWVETSFKERFPYMIPCWTNTAYRQKAESYINSLT